MVREVADADLRSAEAGVCVEGARVGKLDCGLEPGSDGGGASGAATDATAVDMTKVIEERYCSDSRWLLGYFQYEREAQETRLALQGSLDRTTLDGSGSECRGTKSIFFGWPGDGGRMARAAGDAVGREGNSLHDDKGD